MTESQKEYCEFVGSKAFEHDGGWSYEVWQAAQQAVFKRIAARFLGYGDIPYSGKEVADYIKHIGNLNVQK